MLYIPFLRFWLFWCFQSVMSYFAWHYGIVNNIIENDVTKISIIIVFFYCIVSFIIGYRTFDIKNIKEEDEKELYEISNRQCTLGWISGDFFTQLGMIGTVIGLVYCFSNFHNFDIGNIESAREVIKTIAIGVSTALYTTALGLIAKVLTTIQNYHLAYSIKNSKSLQILEKEIKEKQVEEAKRKIAEQIAELKKISERNNEI